MFSLSVAVAYVTDRSPLPRSSESLRPALDHSRVVRFRSYVYILDGVVRGWGREGRGRESVCFP